MVEGCQVLVEGERWEGAGDGRGQGKKMRERGIETVSRVPWLLRPAFQDCTYASPWVYIECNLGVRTYGVPTVHQRCTYDVPTVYLRCTDGAPWGTSHSHRGPDFENFLSMTALIECLRSDLILSQCKCVVLLKGKRNLDSTLPVWVRRRPPGPP